MADQICEDFINLCIQENQRIFDAGLVLFTWGNVSIISPDKTKIAIKPSGVGFDQLSAKKIAIVDIASGAHLSGLKPSVDTPLHLEVYKHFKNTSSVVHTHSHYTTVFAQAKKDIPLLGTTHADYFDYDIPVCGQPEIDQVLSFEQALGLEVVSCATNKIGKDRPYYAVLLPAHGVLLWSTSDKKTSEIAIVLEEIARLAFHTCLLDENANGNQVDRDVFDFHFQRKHGENKYYGQ
ncbi:class II aldolase/adducin family protein [Alphaproteobacteria bacterium]|nr:class II aldolase/adducin family protein [Alphaproteobacteria bacterium]